jgi:hypothetical protein
MKILKNNLISKCGPLMSAKSQISRQVDTQVWARVQILVWQRAGFRTTIEIKAQVQGYGYG